MMYDSISRTRWTIRLLAVFDLEPLKGSCVKGLLLKVVLWGVVATLRCKAWCKVSGHQGCVPQGDCWTPVSYTLSWLGQEMNCPSPYTCLSCDALIMWCTCHVMCLSCDALVMWCAGHVMRWSCDVLSHYSPQNNRANQPWTESPQTVSQSKPFLF